MKTASRFIVSVLMLMVTAIASAQETTLKNTPTTPRLSFAVSLSPLDILDRQISR